MTENWAKHGCYITRVGRAVASGVWRTVVPPDVTLTHRVAFSGAGVRNKELDPIAKLSLVFMFTIYLNGCLLRISCGNACSLPENKIHVVYISEWGVEEPLSGQQILSAALPDVKAEAYWDCGFLCTMFCSCVNTCVAQIKDLSNQNWHSSGLHSTQSSKVFWPVLWWSTCVPPSPRPSQTLSNPRRVWSVQVEIFVSGWPGLEILGKEEKLQKNISFLCTDWGVSFWCQNKAFRNCVQGVMRLGEGVLSGLLQGLSSRGWDSDESRAQL